ncbi:CLUMA_CG000581, isoform A [Clunio marinus]|uniref:CLUMA_CG000581, isoform A n=1 Tax=Clunio marinus TaxID=568069 RepID=A0A1J1HH56_9DIPT|nr:CLUMA_CG000581, isoform A [Clunio marinus]
MHIECITKRILKKKLKRQKDASDDSFALELDLNFSIFISLKARKRKEQSFRLQRPTVPPYFKIIQTLTAIIIVISHYYCD